MLRYHEASLWYDTIDFYHISIHICSYTIFFISRMYELSGKRILQEKNNCNILQFLALNKAIKIIRA